MDGGGQIYCQNRGCDVRFRRIHIQAEGYLRASRFVRDASRLEFGRGEVPIALAVSIPDMNNGVSRTAYGGGISIPKQPESGAGALDAQLEMDRWLLVRCSRKAKEMREPAHGYGKDQGGDYCREAPAS